MAFARWHSYRVRALVLVGALFLQAFVGLRLAGFLGAPAMAMAAGCLMAAVLFGARGLWTSLAVSVLLISTVAYQVVTGHLELGEHWYQPQLASSWTRFTILFSYFLGLVGISVNYLVRQLNGSLQARTELVARLHQEARQRAVAEQERQDYEARLKHAQKLESLGRLAAGVAHDYNNTLTVVLNSAELLQSGVAEDPKAVRDLAADVQSAAEGAASRTSQLLAFGRRSMLTPAGVDLPELLTQTERMLAPLMPSDVHIVLHFDAGLSKVHIDRAQLQDTLVNLCLNARDAMPGGGKLQIEASSSRRGLPAASLREESLRPPGQALEGVSARVYLTISDEGVGMDAATCRRVFDPYFTTRRDAGGSGLGLAMVHGFLEQSGGEIQLHSVPGEGTVFQISLPICSGASGATADSKEARSSAAGSGETLLVVEDEPAVRKVMVEGLRRGGYEVLEASDGVSALAVLRQHGTRVALLCTDAEMPGMEVTELIDRFEAGLPGVPVLVCSGYVESPGLRARLADGQHTFVPKPVSVYDLLDRVRESLERGESLLGPSHPPVA